MTLTIFRVIFLGTFLFLVLDAYCKFLTEKPKEDSP